MGKLINRTGKRYGRLLVLRQEPSIKGNARWLCQCDCGNQVVVYGELLSNGKTKSCGCLMREAGAERRRHDIQGQKFNRLLAINLDHKDNKNNYVWECLCDCGKTVYVPASLLVTGHTKSCGCLQKEKAGAINFEDITGQKYSRLTVEARVGSDDKGQALWRCRCDCGNLCVAKTSVLKRGAIKSCGCMKSYGEQVIQAWLEKNDIEFQKEYRFADCKKEAMLPFDFYLPNYGCYGACIEFDGEQHFVESRLYSEKFSLEKRQEYDRIKNEFCKENNIPLLRIPYWEKDNIESILSDWLFLNDGEEANSSTADLPA